MDAMTTQTLPRKGTTPTHKKLLEIPTPLYNRMLTEAGLAYGEVTGWILEAMKEKLDREKAGKSHEKNNNRKSV